MSRVGPNRHCSSQRAQPKRISPRYGRTKKHRSFKVNPSISRRLRAPLVQAQLSLFHNRNCAHIVRAMVDVLSLPSAICESGLAFRYRRIGACARSGAVPECARILDPSICPASVHVGPAVRGGLRPSKDRFSRGPA